jgi:predicted O-linked N-acetylglucosamine transferase (SPINDLY family)
MTLRQQLEAGVRHHQAGRFREAEAIYRHILSQHPNHFDATFLLGALAVRAGGLDAGIQLLRQAISFKPDHADVHYNLGVALQTKGELNEAILSFRKAIQHRPDFADSHNNLGIALNDTGQRDEAAASYRQAIRLKPDYAEAHYNLGISLETNGQLQEAIVAYRRAIQLKPDFALAYGNLGHAFLDVGRLEDAIICCRQAIRFKPDHAEAHNNLGNALQRKGQLDEAVAAHQEAIRVRPAFAEAYNNLASAWKGKAQLDEAISAYREAIRIKSDFAKAHSNLIVALQYHPASDAKLMQAELQRWAAQHAQPLKKLIQPHGNNRDPQRRLRIGYVSPDFCQHVVGRNILPLLRHHDHGQMHITCYANVASADGLTDQFRTCADDWRDIVKLTDAQAADLIRRDQIDILVDLALHTAGNRLGIFARKPAPVQATFAGYPGSTGLDTIDYRLTDPYLDPPGLNDPFCSETSHRLPDTFWCYDPLLSELPINAPPAQSRGLVTFGCLNNFCKVNESVLHLWGRVLNAVSDSRLLLMAPEGSSRQRVLARFAGDGIDPQRVQFVGKQSRSDYLLTYNRVDIGLDTFPYNGHSTSLDSYWMGVPVITLLGQTMVGRAGLSQLSNLGLPEFIARTPEEYVQIAAGVAGNLAQLTELRQTLRPRMQASALMNAPLFARNIEAAYRTMWRRSTEGE